MSDWSRADDYTTLDEVFSSPEFARSLPPESLTEDPALLTTAAPAAAAAVAAAGTAALPLVASMRNRAIASLCAAGTAVSVVGALVVGSGPVGLPLASTRPGSQNGGQSGQPPATHQPNEFALPGGTGATGGQPTGSAAGGTAAAGSVTRRGGTGAACRR